MSTGTPTTLAPGATGTTTGRPYQSCTEVSLPYCPIQATVLGYYPNEGANIFFAVVFAINVVAVTFFGIRYKTWSYSAALFMGAALETAGYIGRVLLSHNPWNQHAFELQICAIILAPTVVCISIYLTLKHVCLSLSPHLSRVKPNWYPFIFIPGDVTCLLVQGIGGSLAAAGGYDNPKLTAGGNNAIIAGIALQVVVLGAFGILLVDYFWKVRKYFQCTPREEIDGDALRLYHEDKKFWMFVKAMWGAYAVILIRCIYRIAEMAGGWGNHIMQDEISFIVLDSCAMVVSITLLTFFPPGILFPQMAARMSVRSRKKSKKGTNPPTSAGEEEDGQLKTDSPARQEETSQGPENTEKN
ncbi:RTA1 domain-containing protein [Zalerion maritima]|uniref:RTA1 domain-containing protein n=1 Tax=Zalerion maritima TaxID=339359 RepID=A0AAD5WYU1_9PEZI|nr:RTA1 domain-containing protein [Zalerion maritima]